MEHTVNRRRFLGEGALLAGGAAGGGVLSAAAGRPSQAQAEPPVHDAEARLKSLKIDLPEVPLSPTSLIVPCVRAGDLLFVSGHTSVGADGKTIAGRLGQDMEVAQGREAARQVALRVLSVVRRELGSLDRVVRVVKALGMVNCTPEFTQTPQVVNGFSELLVQVFGEAAGKGARSAVGMASLPGGAAVEVEVIFQVR
ncbi:MAG TPA: RidA family protein [Planctomycetota bacterium]|nr:RidA family protein [Planctomycetota bacterium]